MQRSECGARRLPTYVHTGDARHWLFLLQDVMTPCQCKSTERATNKLQLDLKPPQLESSLMGTLPDEFVTTLQPPPNAARTSPVLMVRSGMSRPPTTPGLAMA